MATIAVSGKSGAVNGTAASEIVKWNAVLKFELLDATSFASSGYREYVEGLRGCAGSFDAVGTPPVNGAIATLALGTGGGHTLSGVAKIEDVTYDVGVDGLVKYTASFKYTGSIAVT